MKTSKLNIALRYWLLGISTSNKDYLKCVDALEFASQFHTGLRKDGLTHEFDHQLTITHYLRTLLPSLDLPSETICVALLHDVAEDYDVGFDEIEKRFGNKVANSVEILTKVHRGHKKISDRYFDDISRDNIASIVKGADRIHNLQSMLGVFSKDKQIAYIDEAEKWIIPALKIARRNFPSQEMAYENIKLMMNSQIQLIQFTWK